MKRLLIYAFIYLSLKVCDVAHSQMQVDSVIIELKYMPTVTSFYYDYQRDSYDRYDSYSGPGGVARKIITSIKTLVQGDTIVITGNSTYDGTKTDQRLIVSPDSGLWNSFSISYHEVFATAGDYPLKLHFDFKGLHSEYYGSKSIFFMIGKSMINHLTDYSFLFADFTNAPEIVVTTRTTISHDYSDSSQVSIQLFGSQPLSVKESQVKQFRCYPNPASNILLVGTSTIQEKIEFFDQLGREAHVPEISRTDESVTFNTSSLIPGIYWLRIGSQMQETVIQR